MYIENTGLEWLQTLESVQ